MVYLTMTSSAYDHGPAVFFSIVGVGAAAALIWIAVSFKIQLSDATITFSNGFKRTAVGYHELNSVRYIYSRSRGIYFYWLLLVYGRHGSDKLLYIPLYISRAAFEVIVDRLHEMAPNACPRRPLTLENARAAY